MIAQFANPAKELSVPLWPLVLLAVVYVAMFVAARVTAGRGDERSADGLERIGFIAMLAAGVYTLVIGIYAVAMRSELIWDLIKIMLIIFAFFALLLLFLLLVEMAVGAIGRARLKRRRTRVETAADAPVASAPPSAAPPG